MPERRNQRQKHAGGVTQWQLARLIVVFERLVLRGRPGVMTRMMAHVEDERVGESVARVPAVRRAERLMTEGSALPLQPVMSDIVEGLQHDDADRTLRREQDDTVCADQHQDRDVKRHHHEGVTQKTMPNEGFLRCAQASTFDAPGIAVLSCNGSNQEAIDVLAQSGRCRILVGGGHAMMAEHMRSEEHTSELQS